ncbi:Accessory gene regulator protein B [bioreactor metagenome]|uniref:Accessory gene regulator protein B n=1 Tax=bioreactor metagenome TaxID=1076179 RepID=A0A644WXB1_9ZZZZ
MEKLARKIANNIARSLGYDEEKEAVVAYGLIAGIQIIETFFWVLLAGILIGAPVEAMIVCLSVGFLRQYSGGAHAGTAELCIGVGVVYSTASAFLSRRLLLAVYSPVFMLAAIVVLYLISIIVVRMHAPVDSPNKPIRTEEKRKRMKKFSLIILCAYFALSLILFVFGFELRAFNSYGISLLFGVAWQVFTLTSSGASLLHGVDKLFERR